jgi:hypothetical protein
MGGDEKIKRVRSKMEKGSRRIQAAKDWHPILLLSASMRYRFAHCEFDARLYQEPPA